MPREICEFHEECKLYLSNHGDSIFIGLGLACNVVESRPAMDLHKRKLAILTRF